MPYFPATSDERLDRLTEELGNATALDACLHSDFVDRAGTRIALANVAREAPINRLIRAGAWADAAFSLVEIELPMWRPRRLIHEAGEWTCSLSRHPTVPIELDETADGKHEALPIAILLSFLEAKRRLAAAGEPSSRSVPHVRLKRPPPFWCEDFP